MQVLLTHIRETSGCPALAECGHLIHSLCGGCLKVAYCGQDCQIKHWTKDHQYECIGAKGDREEEEDTVIDLTQLRDLWGIIKPWLDAEDLKNLRLASPEIERQIRRTYFQHFRVRLTEQSFAGFRPEIAPFIAKVDDSKSGGRLAYSLSQMQKNETLKDVFISNNPWVDLDSIIKITHLTALTVHHANLQNLPNSFGNLVNLVTLDLSSSSLLSIPDSFGNLTNLTELHLRYNGLRSLPESFGNLVNLTWLQLHKNLLTKLPNSFGNLVNLTKLTLYLNELTDAEKDRMRRLFGNKVTL